jgi:hypothetical protein
MATLDITTGFSGQVWSDELNENLRGAEFRQMIREGKSLIAESADNAERK